MVQGTSTYKPIRKPVLSDSGGTLPFLCPHLESNLGYLHGWKCPQPQGHTVPHTKQQLQCQSLNIWRNSHLYVLVIGYHSGSSSNLSTTLYCNFMSLGAYTSGYISCWGITSH